LSFEGRRKNRKFNKQVQTRLPDRFGKSAWDLPWRRTHDPCAIWVSEIMLQQTQVEMVIPYFEKFITRLPNVRKLARARLDTVLKLRQGLGYYARARNMHAAAKKIVSEFQKLIPKQRERLLGGTTGASPKSRYVQSSPTLVLAFK
jgi:A/G-specific adenine glycosylase